MSGFGPLRFSLGLSIAFASGCGENSSPSLANGTGGATGSGGVVAVGTSIPNGGNAASGGATSASDRLPDAAVASGYTLNTFHTGPFSATNVDLANSGNSGYQWYLNNPFGFAPTPNSAVTINSDGSLTLTGTANAFNVGQSQGIGFGGGAYFEATISFDPSRVNVATRSWPSWWAMALEHFLALPGEHWTGQPSSYMHFIETDFFEYDTAGFAGESSYGGATHDWWGVWPTCDSTNSNYCNVTNDGKGTPFNNFVINVPTTIDFTQPHRYGYLWVPATGTRQGFAQYYFDSQPNNDKITWSQYNCDAPPAPEPGTVSWTFGVLDCNHPALVLSTGPDAPMTVYSVNVWQGSIDANLVL